MLKAGRLSTVGFKTFREKYKNFLKSVDKYATAWYYITVAGEVVYVLAENKHKHKEEHR